MPELLSNEEATALCKAGLLKEEKAVKKPLKISKTEAPKLAEKEKTEDEK